MDGLGGGFSIQIMFRARSRGVGVQECRSGSCTRVGGGGVGGVKVVGAALIPAPGQDGVTVHLLQYCNH